MSGRKQLREGEANGDIYFTTYPSEEVSVSSVNFEAPESSEHLFSSVNIYSYKLINIYSLLIINLKLRLISLAPADNVILPHFIY
jgi:hypothetical protein